MSVSKLVKHKVRVSMIGFLTSQDTHESQRQPYTADDVAWKHDAN